MSLADYSASVTKALSKNKLYISTCLLSRILRCFVGYITHYALSLRLEYETKFGAICTVYFYLMPKTPLNKGFSS
jgi:hypothetical protein